MHVGGYKKLICTAHFRRRCKERLGLNKNASKSLLKHAVKYGVPVEATRCRRSLYSYLRTLIKANEGKELFIYNHSIIVIRRSGYMLLAITVLNLPKKYQKAIDIINKERRNKNESSRS